MRKTLILLLVVSVILTFSAATIGCKEEAPAEDTNAEVSSDEAKDGTIAESDEEVVSEANYTFTSIMWSSADPNIKWITKPGEDYMALNPSVIIDQVGPEEYGAPGHLEFLEAAIANNVDGIFLHVSDPVALKPAFEKAKDEGIPIVTHTGRFDTSVLTEDLWLSNVGWDELNMGKTPAKYLLDNYGEPVHVAATLAHLGHAGQELRVSGFEQELPEGSKLTKVPVGEDPTQAKEILVSFFQANPDVDVCFNTNSLSLKWVVDALEELGRADDVIQIGTADSPADIEGILLGKIDFTNGIQFYLNGWYPPHILYTYLETGLPGPKYMEQNVVTISKDNAEGAKEMIISIIGQEAYDSANPW